MTPAEAAVIVWVDPQRPLDALIEARRLHSEGQAFVAHVSPGRIRSGFGAHLLDILTEYDERVAAFEALARDRLSIGGKPQHEVVRLDRQFVETAREVIALADGIVVSSWTRHHYLEDILRVTVNPHFVRAVADPPIPQFSRVERPDAVVVWAPGTPARDLSVVAIALEELHMPAFLVCEDGSLEGLRVQRIPYERASEVLSRAAVVIDNARDNPATVVEFARRGVPVAASWLCGAIEYLDNVDLFIPWDRTDILRAVQSALAGEAPRPRKEPEGSRPILTVTPQNVFEVFAEAVALRSGGEPFDLAVRIPDRRTAVAVAVAAEGVRSAADANERRAVLDGIGRNEYEVGGRKMDELIPVDLPILRAMRDLVGLSESVVVRSWTELARITAQFATPPRRVKRIPSSDTAVPAVERGQDDGSVVVWAPRTPAAQLAIVTAAVEDAGRRAKLVCADGGIHPCDAGSMLATASVVFDADNDDPAPARALARIGVPLCVATTSGAREYVSGVHPYRPWHRRSIVAAIEAAFEGPPPELRQAS